MLLLLRLLTCSAQYPVREMTTYEYRRTYKSALCGPMPTSAIDLEDRQNSDYGDDEGFEGEELVPLISSRAFKRATTSCPPLLVFICISLTGLALKLSLDIQFMNVEPARVNAFSNSSVAAHEHLHTFESRGGGAISLYRIQWENKLHHTEDTYICHLQSVCIDRSRVPKSASIGKRYWLMGRAGMEEEIDSIALLDKTASDGFKKCLGHSSSDNKSDSLGLKSVRHFDGDVAWVYGSTLAISDTAGKPSHSKRASIAWLQTWSRFMSISINAAPELLRNLHLTRKHFFKRILFLDQGLGFDHWRTTIFRIANSAAYAALSAPLLAGEEHSMRKLPVRDGKWMDRHAPPQETWGEDSLVIDEATCFENMILIAPSPQFFRDPTDADYFRTWAYNEGGKPQNRSVPHKLQDIKVVMLLHPDKLIRNYQRLVDLLKFTGINNIQVTSITDAMSPGDHLDLWSSADVVITDDHDALTGQTLMRPGSGVLELFSSNVHDDAHAILATKTGIHYAAVDMPQSGRNATDCHGNIDCGQTIKNQAERSEDAQFRSGLRDLLRKKAFVHHCMV